MYFDQLSGACRKQKLAVKLCLLFSTFFLDFRHFFSDFSSKQEKKLKKTLFTATFINEPKKYKIGIPLDQHLGVNQLKGRAKNSVFQTFFLFLDENIEKSIKNEHEWLKPAKASMLTSFGMHKAPKSWWKHLHAAVIQLFDWLF